jgi:hypothetical protein
MSMMGVERYSGQYWNPQKLSWWMEEEGLARACRVCRRMM